jgi:diaminopimelate epimerase
MIAPAPFPFAKMNGLGNEILVVDLRGTDKVMGEDEARAIAAAPRTHFDQMMILYSPRSAGTDAFVDILNTDGSRSAACGNGTRCIGLLEANRTGARSLCFETAAGLLRVSVKDASTISVDMGEPRFKWDEIPLSEPFHDTRTIELQIGPIDAPVLHSPSVVNVGNPHAIFWVPDVSAHDLGRFGPLLENHPLFPERANISLATVLSRDALRIRTWERGAGLSRACGTAACASAIAAMRKGLADRLVTVSVPGGDLVIEWTPNDHIIMTGSAVLEYEGHLEPGTMAAAGA